MAKYLITGRQGAGKSTIIQRLRGLGYTTYDTDNIPGATKLEHRQTGQFIGWPDGSVDWAQYGWS